MFVYGRGKTCTEKLTVGRADAKGENMIDPYEILESRADWNIVCTCCDYAATMKTATDETEQEALLVPSYLHYWLEERDYLLDLEKLVMRFEDSSHPFKMQVLQEGGESYPDVRFDKALEALLIQHSREDDVGDFFLPDQIIAAEEAIEELGEEVEECSFDCPACEEGKLVIAADLWDQYF
ncbi:hypothetical protein BVY04_04090 [bacterium M21]|nr:hypothetical protein BVY04_04090 [bacterium M21]